jgi:hypothetical protein
MKRSLACALAAAAAALTVPAAAVPAGSFPLTLSASGKTLKVGATVTLTARADIPGGISVAIVGLRKGEKTVRQAAKCAKAPCVARWKESAARSVAFQAVLILGGSIVSKSKVLIVTWSKPATAPKPPTPPPSAPAGPAPPGNYAGPTGQTGKTLSFQVTSDGKRVTAVAIDLKSSCNSGEDYHSRVTASPNATINPDKTFSFHLSGSGLQLQFDGKFDSINGTTATGTFEVHSQHNGSECDTGTVTWNAKKTG